MRKLLIILFLFFTSIGVGAQSIFQTEVISVKDGDTLKIKHNDGNIDTVRLLGLDAPEIAHNSKEISQPYGEYCKSLLDSLFLTNKSISIETSHRDNYGRNLARVIIKELDVNLYIIQKGCGWLYYPNGIDKNLRQTYTDAFLNAKLNKVGLFANSKSVTPKIWRKKKHLKRNTK